MTRARAMTRPSRTMSYTAPARRPSAVPEFSVPSRPLTDDTTDGAIGAVSCACATSAGSAITTPDVNETASGISILRTIYPRTTENQNQKSTVLQPYLRGRNHSGNRRNNANSPGTGRVWPDAYDARGITGCSRYP